MIDTREDVKKRISELINKYDQEKREVGGKGLKELSEANVRQNYIDPFFEILGWDVRSDEYYSEKYVRGAGVVDVAIKIDKKPVIFVEAKRFGGIPHYRDRGHQTTLKGEKICVDWTKEERQVLHYADADIDVDWAILTNFEIFRLFNARTGKIVLRIERPKEYLEKIDDILLLTKENVKNKNINKIRERIERKPVDLDFLNLMNDWRLRLARSIHEGTGRGLDEIKGYVQRILDRFVIIRYAEDRWVLSNPDQLRETYEYWNNTKDYNRLTNLLKGLFAGFNTIHDSRIFESDPDLDSVIDCIDIDNEVLGAIINELYGQSFRKFTSDILGNTYETYLGHELYFRNGEIDIRPNQRLQKAGGIYYTPTYVVEYIVNNTLGMKLHEIWTDTERLLDGGQWDEAFKKFEGVSKIRVVDPACGSGSFLIKAFDLFECYYKKYIDKLKEIKEEKKSVLNTLDGLNKLPPQIIKPEFNYAKKILEENLYGVDLDPAAAEIATVNLILRSIRRGEKLPPILGKNIRVGNSLISGDESELHEYFGDGWEDKKPFNWEEEFKAVFDEGGFDFVIGNPPYIRIQTMKEGAPTEVEFYKRHYVAASKGNYDIYVVFVERALQLLNANGRMGYILPHKFFQSKYGQPLRELIARGKHLNKIVHFGDQQVFHGATTYTCLLFLEKDGNKRFRYVKAHDLNAWRIIGEAVEGEVDSEKVTEKEWNFVAGPGAPLFERLDEMPVKLGDVAARLAQGIRTSANEVYVLELVSDDGELIHVHSNQLDRIVVLEKEAVSLFLKGRKIKPYQVLSSGQVVIIPYRVEDGHTTLISESELKHRFPNTYAYLREEAVTLRGVRVPDRTSRSNTPSSRQDMLISPEMFGICALSPRDRSVDSNSHTDCLSVRSNHPA